MKLLNHKWIECLTAFMVVTFALAIVFPAATTARSGGKSAACLANLHILSQAWTAWHQDNDGRLVGGSNYYAGSRGTPYRWVEVPLFNPADNPEAGYPIPSSSELRQEYFLNGIKAGKLYPYVNNSAAYHCPSDRNFVTRPNTEYRSYHVSGLMNGEDFISRQNSSIYSPIKYYRTVTLPTGFSIQLICAEKFSQIKNPSTKYVFVEEDVVLHGQSFAAGSFVTMANDNYWSWWDWFAAFHNQSDSFGFADGHAQVRRWTDMRSILIMKYGTSGSGGLPELQQNNPDIDWVNKGYIVTE